MLEGPTGIGKSHFLQHDLPKKMPSVVFHLEDWLKKPSVLVMDEASFMSQLSGDGENFLERFKRFRSKPPTFFL